MTSSTSMLLPDINVWLPLAYPPHLHHGRAKAWAESLTSGVCFCRITQMGFLRLLTNRSVMGEDALTLSRAWRLYDELFAALGASFLHEPEEIDGELRRITDTDEVSTKQWSDSYLIAFADVRNLTLVTFDKAVARRSRGAVLL